MSKGFKCLILSIFLLSSLLIFNAKSVFSTEQKYFINNASTSTATLISTNNVSGSCVCPADEIECDKDEDCGTGKRCSKSVNHCGNPCLMEQVYKKQKCVNVEGDAGGSNPPTRTPTPTRTSATSPIPTPTLAPPTNLSMTCNGWTAQFSFTKSTDQRVDNYILRANMNNKWATTPQEPLWFLQDGSDQARSTGNVNSFSTTVIPFRHYFDWSLQSVINNVETTKTYNSGSTSSSPAFTCIPEYVLPVGVTAQNCTNTDGALKSECNFDVFRGEYRRQYGYSQQNTGYYPNLISGKNAYQAILTDTNKRELIDLLDFEAWRKAKYQTPTTTQTPPTPTNTPTATPTVTQLITPVIPTGNPPI